MFASRYRKAAASVSKIAALMVPLTPLVTRPVGIEVEASSANSSDWSACRKALGGYVQAPICLVRNIKAVDCHRTILPARQIAGLSLRNVRFFKPKTSG